MFRLPVLVGMLLLSLGHAVNAQLAQSVVPVPRRQGPPTSPWCGARGGHPACPLGATIAVDIGAVAGRSEKTGHLRLLVEPASAEVYIDGFYGGTAGDFVHTARHTRLTAGTHRVEIRAAGYWSPRFEIEIEAGRTAVWRGALIPVGAEP